MFVLNRSQIEARLDFEKAFQAIEEGFRLYSEGKAILPPVGHLAFENPRGDVHIKCGCIEGGVYYVVKIASGFYQNPRRGLPSSQGVLLLFSQQTGSLEAILHDEGYLTDVRTGIAGALAARHLAPPHVKTIGMIGTGTQAFHQLQQLKRVTECRKVLTYGSRDIPIDGYEMEQADSIEDVVKQSALIFTTTPSQSPLIQGEWVQPGTLIIAVGADQPGKQELAPSIYAQATHLIVDSRSQCLAFGEMAHAEARDQKRVLELGEILKAPLSLKEDSITVVDLTGLAIQDLQIAQSVL